MSSTDCNRQNSKRTDLGLLLGRSTGLASRFGFLLFFGALLGVFLLSFRLLVQVSYRDMLT